MLDASEKGYLKELIDEAIEEYAYNSGYGEENDYIKALKSIKNKLGLS